MNFIQRIKCLLGYHHFRLTHYGRERRNGRVVYHRVTTACCYCGKHGTTTEHRYEYLRTADR